MAKNQTNRDNTQQTFQNNAQQGDWNQWSAAQQAAAQQAAQQAAYWAAQRAGPRGLGIARRGASRPERAGADPRPRPARPGHAPRAAPPRRAARAVALPAHVRGGSPVRS